VLIKIASDCSAGAYPASTYPGPRVSECEPCRDRLPAVARRRVAILADSGRLSPRVQNEVDTLLSIGHSVDVLYFDRVARASSATQRPCYTEWSISVPTSRESARIVLALPRLYYRMVQVLRRLRPDVIHATHLFLLPLAIVAALLTSVRVVYDAYEMHALWWSEYVPVGRGPARALFEFCENLLVKWSDCVLAIDSRENIFEKRLRRWNLNVWTIYNVPKLRVELDYQSVAAIRAKYAKRAVVVYIGGINEKKGLGVALDALAKVRERVPEILLLLIGTPPIASDEILAKLNASVASGWAELVGWLPYDRMLEYLACARMGLALHQPGLPAGDLVSRGNGRKFFSYMQASLPIVGPTFGEIGRLVREEKCGLLVDTTDTTAVAAAILELLLDPGRAAELGCRGYAAIETKYNWEIEQAKLVAAYSSLNHERRRWRFGKTSQL
jgi:glycosyltransferase involved in cell wall biosynthesis